MPENTEVTAEAGEQTEDQAPEFKAPASQEELDRIVQARIDRERKKFADYDDLKAAASRLAEIEEANKTEAEKAAARAEAAEKRAAELEATAIRAEVAAEKGVPFALLPRGSREEVEAAADALIEFKGAQKQSPRSPAFGRVNEDTKSVPTSPGMGTLRAAFSD